MEEEGEDVADYNVQVCSLKTTTMKNRFDVKNI